MRTLYGNTMSQQKYKTPILCCLICVFSLFLYSLPTPSNDRDWTLDQRNIPQVKLEDDVYTIENVRDFQYTSETDYQRQYKTVSFSIEDVQTVDFVLSQFAEWRGMAHAFVTFGIQREDSMEYIAISVEIRKEVDETYSPFWGLLKQYELAYVIATETDVIQLRTTHRDEPVYLYPMDVTKDSAQALLTSMLEQAHRLETTPEFYNTVTNSCMSNLAKHVNNVSPDLIPFGFSTVFPGFSDNLIVELGLLSTQSTDIEVIREHHLINPKANAGKATLPFSERIRQ